MRLPRARTRRSIVRPASVTLVVVATLAATTMLGLMAGNTVPGSKAANRSSVVTAEQLKPSTCNGITLTAVVTGSVTVTGGTASELILGSSLVDAMSGGNGDDCILGGASNDSLNGGPGTDVCIGGAGVDTFNASCETQIQ
jgi:Ca2+-binding RTX toxin-like protein